MKPKHFDAPARRESYLKEARELLFEAIKMLPDGQVRRDICSKILPPIVARGQRPGTEGNIRAQIAELFKELARNVRPNIWNRPRHLWSAWVHGLPPIAKGAPRLNDILEGFDNENDAENEPNSKRDIECFELLKQKSDEFLLDRETVNIFYKIGHFVPDDRIEKIISLCRPRSEIRAHHELTSRISKLEERIAPVADLVTDLSEAVDEWVEELKSLTERMATQESHAGGVAEDIAAMKTSLGGFGDSISSLRKGAHELKARVEKNSSRIEQTDHQILKLGKEVVGRVKADRPHAEAPARSESMVSASESLAPNEYRDHGEFIQFLASRLRVRGISEGAEDSVAAHMLSSLVNRQMILFSNENLFWALAESLSWGERVQRFVVDTSWFQPNWITPYGRLPGPDAETFRPRIAVFEDFDRAFPEAYVLPYLKAARLGLPEGGQHVVTFGSFVSDDVHVTPGHGFFSRASDLSHVYFRPHQSVPFMNSVFTYSEKSLITIRSKIVPDETSKKMSAALSDLCSSKPRMWGWKEMLEDFQVTVEISSPARPKEQAAQQALKSTVLPALLRAGVPAEQILIGLRPFGSVYPEIQGWLQSGGARFLPPA